MKTLRNPVALFDVFVVWNSSDHGSLIFLPKDEDNGAIIEKMMALQQRLASTDFELFEKKEKLEQVLNRLNELSGPFIPLSDTLCMVPIFGDITSEKINVISEKCLQEVFAGEYDEVLVDLTAVGEISPKGIEAFTRLLKTLHFMTGSFIKLIGISPELVKRLNPYGLGEFAVFDTSLRDALKKHFV